MTLALESSGAYLGTSATREGLAGFNLGRTASAVSDSVSEALGNGIGDKIVGEGIKFVEDREVISETGALAAKEGTVSASGNRLAETNEAGGIETNEAGGIETGNVTDGVLGTLLGDEGGKESPIEDDSRGCGNGRAASLEVVLAPLAPGFDGDCWPTICSISCPNANIRGIILEAASYSAANRLGASAGPTSQERPPKGGREPKLGGLSGRELEREEGGNNRSGKPSCWDEGLSGEALFSEEGRTKFSGGGLERTGTRDDTTFGDPTKAGGCETEVNWLVGF